MGMQMVAQIAGQGVKIPGPPPGDVERIAEQRGPDRGEVNADLMGAARPDPHFRQVAVRFAPQQAVVAAAGQTLRIGAPEPAQPGVRQPADRHFDPPLFPTPP